MFFLDFSMKSPLGEFPLLCLTNFVRPNTWKKKKRIVHLAMDRIWNYAWKQSYMYLLDIKSSPSQIVGVGFVPSVWICWQIQHPKLKTPARQGSRGKETNLTLTPHRRLLLSTPQTSGSTVLAMLTRIFARYGCCSQVFKVLLTDPPHTDSTTLLILSSLWQILLQHNLWDPVLRSKNIFKKNFFCVWFLFVWRMSRSQL